MRSCLGIQWNPFSWVAKIGFVRIVLISSSSFSFDFRFFCCLMHNRWCIQYSWIDRPCEHIFTLFNTHKRKHEKPKTEWKKPEAENKQKATFEYVNEYCTSIAGVCSISVYEWVIIIYSSFEVIMWIPFNPSVDNLILEILLLWSRQSFFFFISSINDYKSNVHSLIGYLFHKWQSKIVNAF